MTRAGESWSPTCVYSRSQGCNQAAPCASRQPFLAVARNKWWADGASGRHHIPYLPLYSGIIFARSALPARARTSLALRRKYFFMTSLISESASNLKRTPVVSRCRLQLAHGKTGLPCYHCNLTDASRQWDWHIRRPAGTYGYGRCEDGKLCTLHRADTRSQLDVEQRAQQPMASRILSAHVRIVWLAIAYRYRPCSQSTFARPDLLARYWCTLT